MKTNQTIKELVLLSHITTLAKTIYIADGIVEWLSVHEIVYGWQIYAYPKVILELEKAVPEKEFKDFKKMLTSLCWSFENTLTNAEIKGYQIKSYEEHFRFDLLTMSQSFEEIRMTHDISPRLFNILMHSANLKYPWMLYENMHTDTTGKSFQETFLRWRGTSKKSLDELKELVDKLGLPELDSIKFSDEELHILAKICE